MNDVSNKMDTCIHKTFFEVEIIVGVDWIQLFELMGLRFQCAKCGEKKTIV